MIKKLINKRVGNIYLIRNQIIYCFKKNNKNN